MRGRAKGKARKTIAKSKIRFTKRCLIRCFIEKISSPIYFLASNLTIGIRLFIAS